MPCWAGDSIKGTGCMWCHQWNPLTDWNDTVRVKDAAEEMTGEDICFGNGIACLRDDGGYPVNHVSHENTRRAVLCVALSAVRAKKASVKS